MTARDTAITAVDAYAADSAAQQKATDDKALAAMTAERDALQAQLTALQPPNTFGMAVGPTSGAIADDLNNFKAVVTAHPNLGVKVRRSYTPGTKTTYTEALPGAGILPFFSQKPALDAMASGSLDSWASGFAKSCPDGAFLTIQHEPENPSKGITASAFVNGFNRWAKVTKQANPNVKVGPCYMEWQMRTQGAGWGYGNIDASLIDFWSFDAYVTDAPNQGYLKTDSAATLCNHTGIPVLNKLRAGLPFVIAEIGLSNKQGQDRTAWLNTARKWAKGANVSLLYYNVSEWMYTDSELAGITP